MDKPRKPSLWPPANRKPWMHNRSGESDRDRITRLTSTCYGCGMFIAETDRLRRHTDRCDKTRGDQGS